MSRNKREGQYAGCIRGKHVRAVVTTLGWSEHFTLPCNLPNSRDAFTIGLSRSVFHYWSGEYL